jgi:hypothetical protein
VLSCPSAALCVAADSHHRVFYSTNPGGGSRAWHSFSFDPTETIVSLSCPTTALCVGYDTADGNIVTANNPARGRAAWSISWKAGGGFWAMTCASASLCIASGYPATYFSYHPSRGASAWKHAGTNLIAKVLVCPSASLCLGAGGNGFAWTTTPTASGNNVWSYLDTAGLIPAVACVSQALCVAGDSYGELIVGIGP